MIPRYDDDAERFRGSVRQFIDQHVPATFTGLEDLADDERQAFLTTWRMALYEERLLAPDWPYEYGGGGLSAVEQVVLAEELTLRGLPGGVDNDPFGITLLGNTVLTWGSEEQKQTLLPRILSSADRWCQGFSEPNAGSDLGSLTLTAVDAGDEWVLNGQKIWTSRALTANRIFVLARTDPEAPKHAGISFLLVDLEQPGIERRPIRMLTGGSEFCETFFTDARVPKDQVLGGIGNGWKVAMSLLGFERGKSAATMPIRFRKELDSLITLARANGSIHDPIIRDRIAEAYTLVEVMRTLGLRELTAHLSGRPPGPEGGVIKLYWSEYHRKVTDLAMAIAGASATVAFPHPELDLLDADGDVRTIDHWVGTFMFACADTIYGGSSEIQRNIIGERLLGLPKEPTQR